MSSYVVLARKWRPQRFTDLTGQGHVAQTLENAIEQGRVPHALLFTGARGVGKTSSARILAMALNCAEGPTVNPCGKCSACTEIQKSQSVDVLEIDGASNRGINEIRELRDGVRYAPNRDRYKVYIIDEVHMLTTEAFNALLKTLEEPPKHVVFIFATTEAQKIPVTILSRCQRFDFRRIPHAEIVSRLTEIAAAEGLDVDAEVLGIVARQAAGGMRDALSLMDQVIAFAGNTIRLADAEGILGAAERRRLFELSAALVDQDVERCLKVVDEVDAFGVDLSHFSVELVSHLRDLSIVAVAKDPAALTSLTDGEIEDARSQVARTDVATLHRMFERMVDAAESIARSNHPRLLLEMALVRMTAIEPVISMKRLINRLESLSQGASLPPSDEGASGSTPPTGGTAPTGSGASSTGASSEQADAAEASSPQPASADAVSETPAPAPTSGRSAPEALAPTASSPAPSASAEGAAELTSTEPADDAPPRTTAASEAAPPRGEATSVADVKAATTTPNDDAPSEQSAVEAVPAETAVAEPVSVSEPIEEVAATPPPAADQVPAVASEVEVAPNPVSEGPSQTNGTASPSTPDLPDVTALHSELAALADRAPSQLSEETWTTMVHALRKEQPHAGELMASARALADGDTVTLAFQEQLLDNVHPDILGRLTTLATELSAGTLDFRAISEKNVPPSALDSSYHVAGREEEARLAREAAARDYVMNHTATALLLERFPGSRVARVDVPDAPMETTI